MVSSEEVEKFRRDMRLPTAVPKVRAKTFVNYRAPGRCRQATKGNFYPYVR